MSETKSNHPLNAQIIARYLEKIKGDGATICNEDAEGIYAFIQSLSNATVPITSLTSVLFKELLLKLGIAADYGQLYRLLMIGHVSTTGEAAQESYLANWLQVEEDNFTTTAIIIILDDGRQVEIKGEMRFHDDRKYRAFIESMKTFLN